VNTIARVLQPRLRGLALIRRDLADVLRRARERVERLARGGAVLRARVVERTCLRFEVAPVCARIHPVKV